MTQHGNLIDRIDVWDELQDYPWRQANLSDDKLIACSPFRDDHQPSFYVWLRGEHKGTFGDSGSYDDYAKGGFYKLLAFLREESISETIDYLREKYGDGVFRKLDDIKIPEITVAPRKARKQIPDMLLDTLEENYDYLEGRGISAETQRLFGIKYDPRHNSVAFPWRYVDGVLGNIKYRNIDEKQFYYAKDGQPVNSMVFGLTLVYDIGARKVAITEAETDAMTLWESGQPAIALGHGSITPKQVELITKSPIEYLVIATDDDPVGNKLAARLYETFKDVMTVTRRKFGGHKDANAWWVASKFEKDS